MTLTKKQKELLMKGCRKYAYRSYENEGFLDCEHISNWCRGWIKGYGDSMFGKEVSEEEIEEIICESVPECCEKTGRALEVVM